MADDPAAGRSLKSRLFSTNHKDVGVLYFWSAFFFMLIGGLLAELIRVQLAVPDNNLLSADDYNQAVTLHGAVMVLFFLSPLTAAFANYFVPLQIGAKDLAFPRINALSFWLFLFGGLVAAAGFPLGGAADVGWTFYSPLTNSTYSPGPGVDLAGAGLVLLFASVTVSTINFLVTIVRHRRPGLKWMDLPMFTWSWLVTSAIMLLAFPALGGALVMLVADRHVGTHFLDPNNGGALLWAHLFWFFGHPEVYIVFFPALGAVAEVLPRFAGRALFSRQTIIYMWIVGACLSMVVWAHHMFATGIDPGLREAQSVMTEFISIPFGIVFLCFYLTLHKARIRFDPPMLFALGMIGIFFIGGATGIFLSSLVLDVHFRGSYFVVAHFHYTLIGGSVLGMFAGVYYWYPMMFGRYLGLRMALAHFWASIIGFNLTFFPLFTLSDMPRRIQTYSEPAWADANLIATFGALIFGVAQLIFVFNLVLSRTGGKPAPEDPWERKAEPVRRERKAAVADGAKGQDGSPEGGTPAGGAPGGTPAKAGQAASARNKG
jgi:cytochrome c oxidase subunit I+III